jgi:hypothetical protein
MEVSGRLQAPTPLPSEKTATGTHWIGDWLGPRAGLDAVEKRKISCPCRDSNPSRSARSYTDCGIPARI